MFLASLSLHDTLHAHAPWIINQSAAVRTHGNVDKLTHSKKDLGIIIGH